MSDSATNKSADSNGNNTAREGRLAPVAFKEGLEYPLRGLRFLSRQPKLWPLAALPFLLCIVLYALMIYLGWHWIGGWIDSALIEGEGWWWRWLGRLLQILFWIVALGLSVLAYVPVAAVLASPFNDLLSEKTERIYRGIQIDEPLSFGSLIRSIRVGMIGELQRSATLAVLLLLALSLNLIPGFGQLAATVLSTGFTIYYLSLEFTSFSMDRRYYTWPMKRGYLRRFRFRSIGFGTAAFLIMMVPVVNALFIPVSAIAGTLLYCDTELKE